MPSRPISIQERMMTEVEERASIEEALQIIDTSLGGLTDRELVSASEVTNLLLDVRALLSGRLDQQD